MCVLSVYLASCLELSFYMHNCTAIYCNLKTLHFCTHCTGEEGWIIIQFYRDIFKLLCGLNLLKRLAREHWRAPVKSRSRERTPQGVLSEQQSHHILVEANWRSAGGKVVKHVFFKQNAQTVSTSHSPSAGGRHSSNPRRADYPADTWYRKTICANEASHLEPSACLHLKADHWLKKTMARYRYPGISIKERGRIFTICRSYSG